MSRLERPGEFPVIAGFSIGLVTGLVGSHAIPLNPHRFSGCGYFRLGLLT